MRWRADGRLCARRRSCVARIWIITAYVLVLGMGLLEKEWPALPVSLGGLGKLGKVWQRLTPCHDATACTRVKWGSRQPQRYCRLDANGNREAPRWYVTHAKRRARPVKAAQGEFIHAGRARPMKGRARRVHTCTNNSTQFYFMVPDTCGMGTVYNPTWIDS